MPDTDPTTTRPECPRILTLRGLELDLVRHRDALWSIGRHSDALAVNRARNQVGAAVHHLRMFALQRGADAA